MQISTQENQNIEKNLQQTISNTNEEPQKTNENLTQLLTAKERLEKAKENERRVNHLKENNEQMKLDMKTELINDLKKFVEESIKTSDLIGTIETMEPENKDLRNVSMISTLIFRGVPKSEKKKDSWEAASQNRVSLLAAKLNMDCYELNMQISSAHRTPRRVRIKVIFDP